METPSLKHVKREDYDRVYEPAEDTFLMLDALETELNIIKEERPLICLEIGSGSGVVISAIAKCLGSTTCCFATDVNVDAANLTARTAKNNDVFVEPVIMDLVDAFHSHLFGSVDLLIFNPPYVVTPDEEVGKRNLSASWAGGDKGRRIMDRIFPFIPKLLSSNGKFYLLIIEENCEDEIQYTMESFGLHMNVVLRRRCGAEKLSVLRFTR